MPQAPGTSYVAAAAAASHPAMPRAFTETDARKDRTCMQESDLCALYLKYSVCL